MAVKCVIGLVQKAMADKNKDGQAILMRNGQETYKVVYMACFGELCLYHYGTLILRVAKFNKSEFSIVKVGGYSSSDQGAINSVLDHLNIPRYVIRRGGFLRLA